MKTNIMSELIRFQAQEAALHLQLHDLTIEKIKVLRQLSVLLPGTRSDEACTLPEKGNYSDLRRFIHERKQKDESFKNYCESHSRVELCKRLTDELGWEVHPHSLGKNINRNR